MIQNPITFVISNNGTILGGQRDVIRALSNYTSKIYVVAPFESVSISVSYLIYNLKRQTIEQVLAPTSLTGKDLLSTNDEQYQTAANWSVWEVNISQRALHRIAKYRAGRIGVTFNVTTISQPTQALSFINYFARTQSEDLPISGSNIGDYYISRSYNFTSARVANETFTYNDYAYWNGTAWKKGKNIATVVTTENTDLAVDGSLLDTQPDDITQNQELINSIDSLISDVSDLTSDLNAHIGNTSDPHEIQASQVEASYRSSATSSQAALNSISQEIDNVTGGTTNITYDPAQDDIITSTTVAGALGELDQSLHDHKTNTSNPHSVTGSQVNTTFNSTQVTVESALSTLQATKVNKNPDTITDVSQTDKVYVNDGTEKLITVGNLKNAIYEDLVSFGYIIFSSKDSNGLPDVSNPLPNRIYLYDITDVGNDGYEEWLYVESGWERIGTTALDLTNYYTKTQTDALHETALRKQIYPNTKNTSGSVIPKGAVVQFAGSQGDHLLIKQAVASEIIAQPELFMGLAENDIANNAFGNVVWFGNIIEYNAYKDDNGTNLWPNGTILYFDSSTGGLTEVRPDGLLIVVAAVEKAASSENAENGILMVRVHKGQNIADISGIDTDGVVNGDVLQYNSTTENFEAAKMKGVYFDNDLPAEADRFNNLVYFDEEE